MDDLGDILKFPLMEALLSRRSRRFAKGLHLTGPLSYKSKQKATPLAKYQEAALAFAACGITGSIYADLPYSNDLEKEEGGGNIITNFVGRTVASGDNIHAVIVFVLNDEGVWMLKRPQDYPSGELAHLLEDTKRQNLIELYDKARIKISDKRLGVPRQIPFVPAFNKWSAEREGTTTFLPVNELSALYINVLLAAFSEEFGAYIVDDKRNLRPAGLAGFGRSKGGFLYDNPKHGRLATVSFVENWINEFAAIEQGGVLQNLGLMGAALNLGGFPYFAAHPYSWFQSLGFRMIDSSVSKITGCGPVLRSVLKLLKKDETISFAAGLESEGEILIKPFCPPYYKNMEEAVLAFIAHKYAEGKGTLRDGGKNTSWKEPHKIQQEIPEYSDKTISAVIAYCNYIYNTYGRFPASSGPFRTILAYQAHYLDDSFYSRYYRSK